MLQKGQQINKIAVVVRFGEGGANGTNVIVNNGKCIPHQRRT